MSSSDSSEDSLAQRIARASGTDLSLRPERDDDRAFLRDLYASVRERELAPVPWSAEEKRRFLDSQFDLQHDYYREHYVGAEFLIVMRNGMPVGRLYVYRSSEEIRVMDVALIEAIRAHGLGTKLLQGLLDVAEAERCKVTLHVEHDNPALSLYERLGFLLIENRGVNRFLGWTPDSLS